MLRELKRRSCGHKYNLGGPTIVTHPAPLLVFLSLDIPLASIPPDSAGTTDKDDLLQEEQDQQDLKRIEITNAVARTHEVLRDIIKNDSASNCSMAWYVQPYERTSSIEGPFKNGIYPGINWVIRAMQKQNCTYKTY